mgnify:CR=1 FL=1
MFIGFTAVWIRFLKYSNVFITDKKLKNTVKSRDFNTYRRIDKCLQREYYFIHEKSITIDITIIQNKLFDKENVEFMRV